MQPPLRLALGALSLSLTFAQGRVLLIDDFGYTDGLLQDVAPAWEPTTISGTGNLAIAAGSASYATSGDTSIRVLYQSSLGESVSSGSLFYAFTFNASTASTTGGGQRIAGLGTGSTTSDSMRGQLWLKGGSTSDAFLLGISTFAGSSSSTNWWTSDLNADNDYQVVVEYNASEGSSTLWIDPVTTDSPSIAGTDGLNTSTRSTMGLYNRTNVNLGSFTIDNLTVATEFSDVVGPAVPEPGALPFLIGLVAALSVVCRRK